MIEFDPAKEAVNPHGLPFAFAAEIFEGNFIEEIDSRFDYGEDRYKATGPVGSFNGKICTAIYTWRGTARRIISFRRAGVRELRKYRRRDA